MKSLFVFTVLFYAFSAIGAPVKLPLRYDKNLVEQGFASPVISVKVNGKKALFLIDTGASFTVVSRSFAAKAKIQSNGSGSLSGSAGGHATSSLAQVNFLINEAGGGEVSFLKHHLMIVELPAFFQENGLAGIISPQQLLQNNQVGVLNLSENPFFEIYEKSPQMTDQTFQLNPVFSDGPGGKKTVLFTVDALVEGVKTSFIIDTGADGAGVGLETLAGKNLYPKSVATGEKVGGITGKPEDVRIVSQAQVKIFNKNVKMKIRLQPASKKMPADGMLGMQFLKNCTLILSLKNGWISCS